MGCSAMSTNGTESFRTTESALREVVPLSDLRELVRRLNGSLGSTLVAALAGSSEPREASGWADFDGPDPGSEAAQRLGTAYNAWWKVAEAEGEAVARAWFVGANPWLEDDSPVNSLRTGRIDAVERAAQAVVDESFSG